MEQSEFEKRFLALVNQTAVVITAPNIAYHLDIPIEEAQEHLLSLELNGVILQDRAEEGNAVYAMPNRPTPGTLPARVTGEEPAIRADGPKPGVHNPADLPPAPIYGGPQTAPAKGRNVNGLVLNVIFPGLGSVICGRTTGFWMMGLVLLAIVLLFALSGWSRLLSVLVLLVSWVWSVSAGLNLLNEREPGPGSAR